MDIFKRGCIGLVFFLMLGRLLWGGVVIDSLTVTNYTGYILDSDRGKLGGNHDSIDVQSELVFSSKLSEQTTYRLTYTLLSADDIAVPLLHDGLVATTIRLTTNLTLFPNTPVSKSLTMNLVPAKQLSPYTTYRPHILVEDYDGFPIALTNASGSATNYIHFTNTNSTDEAYNVIPVMQSLTMKRDYALVTMPEKGSFIFDAVYDLYRYDEYNEAISSALIPVRFNSESTDQSSSVVLPFNTTSSVLSVNMPNHAGVLGTYPAVIRFTNTLYMTTTGGNIVNPLNVQDVSSVIQYKYGPISAYSNGNAASVSDLRLLQLEGTLLFGSVTTRLYSITNELDVAAVLSDYVTTRINIASYGAAIADSPHFMLDDESTMLIRVDSNGIARCDSSGSWDIRKTGGSDTDVWENVSILRSDIVIRTNALRAATVRVQLPLGCGYSSSDATQILEPFLTFSNINLTSTMRPADATATQVGTYYLSEETKPFRMRCDQVTWLTDEGRFEWFLANATVPVYVRKEAMELLSNNVAEAKDSGAWVRGETFRRSNEMYYQYMKSYSSDRVIVQASTNNGSALTTIGVNFEDDAAFVSAFPYNCAMGWRSGAHISFSNDLISVSDSGLHAAQPLTVGARTSCPGDSCPSYNYGLTNYFTIMSPSNELFTSDGGIFLGPSPVSKGLSWNYISGAQFVHNITSHFNKATFYMPGHFVRGEDALTHAFRLPVAILLAGVLTNTLSDYENPYSENYFDGYGDYAGINLRLNDDGPMFAKSVIAGTSMGEAYQLSDRCKYYLRYSGVSGLHEAEEGTFPDAAELYGYPLVFSNFSLSYLSGLNKDSRTRGSISVPYPSAFTQRFDRLTLTCLGDLDSARVPDDAEDFTLAYWGSQITPYTMRFAREQSCSPGDGFLVLGIGTRASMIEEDLQTALGFEANGNLITPAKGLTGIDSRFPVNSSFKIATWNEKAYDFYPISTVYLNTYSNAPPDLRDPGDGWVNIAGTIDIPFFENMEVHVIADAEAGQQTFLSFAGGWEAGRGWTEDDQNFFTTNLFDKGNNGYPAPYTEAHFDDYQSDSRTYRPAARQKWLDILEFDTALSWSFWSRGFTSFKPVETQDLLVVSAKQEVTYMNPTDVNISFGVRMDGSPNITTESIMANARDEAVDMGIGDFFLETTGETEGGKIRYVSITNGLAAMDMLTDNDMSVFDVAIKYYIDVTISNMIADLSMALDNDATYDEMTNVVWGYFNPEAQGIDNIRHILSHMTDRQAYATNLVTHMAEATQHALDLIDVMIDGVNFDTNGVPLGTNYVTGLLSLSPDVSGTLMRESMAMIGVIGPLLGGVFLDKLEMVATEIEKQIAKAISENASKLRDARDVMLDAKITLEENLTMLNDGGAYINMISNAITEEAVASVCTNAYAKTIDYLDPYLHFYDAIPPSPAKDYIAQQIIDALNEDATFMLARMEVINAYNDNASENIKDAMNKTLQTYEDTINEALTAVHNAIDDNLIPALGGLSDNVKAGHIDGFAVIKNDLLDMVKLDGDFEFKTEKDQTIKTSGTVTYKAHRASDGPTCAYDVTNLTHEVDFEARGVPMDLGEGRVIAGMHGKFAFETHPYRTVGLNGGLETYAGYIPVTDRMNITKLIAEFGFSENEAYFGGQAEAMLHIGHLMELLHEYADDHEMVYSEYYIKQKDGPALSTNNAQAAINIEATSTSPYFSNYMDLWYDVSGNAPEATPPETAQYIGRANFELFKMEEVLTTEIQINEGVDITNITVYAKSGNTNWNGGVYARSRYNFKEPMTEDDVVDFSFESWYEGEASFWWGAADFVLDVLGPAEYALLVLDDLNILDTKLVGGFYAGRCCDLDVLRAIDEEVGDIVKDEPFAGVYILVEGHQYLVNWDCWLRLGAGLGFGMFSFTDGPWGLIGTAACDGEALCTVSVSGEARLTGALNGLDSAVSGSGRLRGKAGWCPFCVKVNSYFRLTLGRDRWEIDIDL